MKLLEIAMPLAEEKLGARTGREQSSIAFVFIPDRSQARGAPSTTIVHKLCVGGREFSQFEPGVVVNLRDAMEQGFVVCGREDGENNILREFNFSFFENKIVWILCGVEAAAQPFLKIIEQDKESTHIDAEKLNQCRYQYDGAHWEASWLYGG